MLDNLISNFIDKKVIERKYKIGVYYPSELPFCLRKQFFRYTVPKDVAPEQKRVFGVGWVWHQFIYQVLKNSKDVKVLEVEKTYRLKHPSKKIILECTPDAKIQKNGKQYLIEIKSAKALTQITEPQIEHVFQIMPYMYATQTKKAILLYIHKTTLETKEFQINFEPEKLTLMFERARRLDEALRKKVLPSRVGAGGEWQCKNCEYRIECETFIKTSQKLEGEK